MTPKMKRGFAALKESDPKKLRQICSRGGRKAHEFGSAHEWTTEQAREAGRKGGTNSHRNRRKKAGKPEPEPVRETNEGGTEGVNTTHNTDIG